MSLPDAEARPETDPEAGTGPQTEAARAARRHLTALLAGIVATAAAIGLWGWWLGPPVGDLARIGGQSERAFGWRGAVESFARDHYDAVSPRALIAGADPGEVLVFGDSFSIKHDGAVSWINTLHAETGLSVRFARIEDFGPVMRWLASEAARARPPRAVIVQTVEREVAVRGRALAVQGAPCTPTVAPAPIAAAGPLELPRRRFERRTAFAGIDEVFSWGALAARLRLTGGGPVLEAGLTRADLFSHREPTRLLLLARDVEAHLPAALEAPPERAAAEMRCGLRRLAAAAEGVAPLWLMIAPDKRSAYAPWIADPLPEKALDLFAEAEAALGPVLIDLLGPLRAAAEAGRRDLYWPNDTHWGAAGHRLAGEAAALVITGGMITGEAGKD